MSNRYSKYFKPNFKDRTLSSDLIKRNLWIKRENILNFKILKVQRQCDKV